MSSEEIVARWRFITNDLTLCQDPVLLSVTEGVMIVNSFLSPALLYSCYKSAVDKFQYDILTMYFTYFEGLDVKKHLWSMCVCVC